MPGETALIFDDDKFFRTLWSDTLTDLDLQVTAFPTHAAFLAQINADCGPAAAPCPDFILTDNQMPGMSGLEFLARIGQLGCKVRRDRMGIISGRWEAEEIEQARNTGYRIFQKFNSPEQIRAWIAEARTSPDAPDGATRG